MTYQSASKYAVLAGAATLLLFTGCKKTADNTVNYKNAIDAFYSAHPSCLFAQPQQFPTQVAPSDASKTAPLAALVDQGLLTRTSTEKKIIIISKQETNYDLSDKGRSDWTADPSQPGYGNFCYGHRKVDTITSSTPNNGQVGDTTQLQFNYTFTSAPDWVKGSEMQNAFPQLSADMNGGTASATLVDTNTGWQIQTPPPVPHSHSVATAADGKIVQ